MSLQWPPTAGGRLHRDRAGCAAVKVHGGKGVCGLRTGRGRARRREGPHLCSRAGVDGEGTGAPEQLRAPPRGLLPAAAAPRLLPRCAAPGAGAESPPQLLGRPGRVTPPPPVHLSDLTDRMESPEGAGPGGEYGPSPLSSSCAFSAAGFSPSPDPPIRRAKTRRPSGSSRTRPGQRREPGPGASRKRSRRRAGGAQTASPPPCSPRADSGSPGESAPWWVAQSSVLSPLPAEPGRGGGEGLRRTEFGVSDRKGVGVTLTACSRVGFVRPSSDSRDKGREAARGAGLNRVSVRPWGCARAPEASGWRIRAAQRHAHQEWEGCVECPLLASPVNCQGVP
jgi:hypothetical protein